MQPGPMFRTITEYTRLGSHLAQVWWQAVSKAQWSEARSWKQDLVYFDQQPRSRLARLDGVLPFLRVTSPPSRVVQVLESLVGEQLLTRAEASAIEERVLVCLDHEGRWRWSP